MLRGLYGIEPQGALVELARRIVEHHTRASRDEAGCGQGGSGVPDTAAAVAVSDSTEATEQADTPVPYEPTSAAPTQHEPTPAAVAAAAAAAAAAREEVADGSAATGEEAAAHEAAHGDTARSEGRLLDAIAHYNTALALDDASLASLAVRLGKSHTQYELGDHDDSVSQAFEAIRTARQHQQRLSALRKLRRPRPPPKPDPTAIIARGYQQIGDNFSAQGKRSRAANAYLLAHKEELKKGGGGGSATSSPSKPVRRTNLWKKLAAARGHGQAKGTAQGRKSGGAEAGGAAEVADIEDLGNRHALLGFHDTFKFECTMCGECW